jgi:mono/diheme cytochrome c family protein
MITRRINILGVLALGGGLALFAGLAQGQQDQQGTKLVADSKPAPAPAAAKTTSSASNSNATAAPAAPAVETEEAQLAEGEKRFHDNCGRCHQAPHKLAPRMMATAIRHMRVRATITDEDMRLILRYMTQ